MTPHLTPYAELGASQTYLENLCIIYLIYLEVRDSFDVLGRFVNLYIMVIIVSTMAFGPKTH